MKDLLTEIAEGAVSQDETEHLLSSPENAERLAEAIKQFDAGEVSPPNPVSHEGGGVMAGPSKCVVFYSGGLGSWAAAKRAVAKYGVKNTRLLFTDVKMEDPTLYDFLHASAANVSAELVVIEDGRTPWEVFRDKKLIGNTRKDPCSEILKRQLGRDWLATNVDPQDTALVFGIGWEEQHRYDLDPKPGSVLRRGVKNVYARLGYPHVEAPLLDSPWLTSLDLRAWARLEGLPIPRLYSLGFAHNNCGGFCVKAGEGHFAHLLKVLPEVYAYHEAQEEAFNAARPGKRRQTVLAPEREVGRDPAGKPIKKRVPISLREFREHIQAGGTYDLFDIGGCDCFYPTEEAA